MRGRDIRMEREARGLRQDAVAKEAGLNLGTVIDIEKERIEGTDRDRELLLAAIGRLAPAPQNKEACIA